MEPSKRAKKGRHGGALLQESESDSLVRSEQEEEPEQQQQQKQSKKWIFFAIQAAILFTVCNTAIAEISEQGAAGILYFCAGTFVCGVVYFLMRLNKSATKEEFWEPFNFYDYAKRVIILVNIIGFTLFALDYFIY